MAKSKSDADHPELVVTPLSLFYYSRINEPWPKPIVVWAELDPANAYALTKLKDYEYEFDAKSGLVHEIVAAFNESKAVVAKAIKEAESS